MVATPNRWAEITLWTSTPACRVRGTGVVRTGWGDFTGPPLSSEMAIRASSTAISTARTHDTNLGPSPCKRDSHSCVRVSSMVFVNGYRGRQSYGLPAWPLKHLFLLVKVK